MATKTKRVRVLTNIVGADRADDLLYQHVYDLPVDYADRLLGREYAEEAPDAQLGSTTEIADVADARQEIERLNAQIEEMQAASGDQKHELVVDPERGEVIVPLRLSQSYYDTLTSEEGHTLYRSAADGETTMWLSGRAGGSEDGTMTLMVQHTPAQEPSSKDSATVEDATDEMRETATAPAQRRGRRKPSA